ncbi:MAG: putative DNA binding domain-containing protein [Saprospiraceae bacterium]|nr:putative DNA binding domain-containing protein [Saprospiraceae bacterium]
MTRNDLFKRLQDIEWENFEVKKAEKAIPKNSWETVSAFANTGGGWLVFGVSQIEQDFKITGVNNPEKIEQDFVTTLRSNQKFNVRIDPICKKYEIEDNTVLAFNIPVSAQKPVYFNNLKNTFIRTASGDQRATQAEIDAMYRDQAFGTKDRELTSFDSEALDQKSIERYRNYLAAINPSHSYNLISDHELLQKLQVTKDGKVTVAGLLFFGTAEKIEEMLTDFRIDYLEIPGTSLVDAEERYSFRLDQQQNVFEYYFAIYPRLLQKIDIPFKMTHNGMATEEQPHVQSLREALVNMLMHADYFSSSKPRIRVFLEHIEFYNPGGLPKNLDELRKADISQPRNPLIAKMFRVIKLAETAGYGFDKIFRGWSTYVNVEPICVSGLDYVDLKMTTKKTKKLVDGWSEKWSERWSDEWSDELSERQKQILKLIIINPKISRKTLSENIGINPSAIQKNIDTLKRKDIIRRVGSARNGHWEIVNP